MDKFKLTEFNEHGMSNFTQQKHLSQSFSQSPELAQLIAMRQELEQTRERLLKLRTEVDSIIGYNPLDQSDSQFYLS
jgi:hypothetical protein